MKLFFRFKDKNWSFGDLSTLTLTDGIFRAYWDGKLEEFELGLIESISIGDHADRDAESAIRALLPKAESKEIKAVLSATYEGGSTECYPLTDYHVEFHTGEVTPPKTFGTYNEMPPITKPSPPKVKSCLNCQHKQLDAFGNVYCNHSEHYNAFMAVDTTPCDDWEAKP